VALGTDFQGLEATLAKYDEVVRRLGGTPGDPGGPHPAEGCLFHFVTVDPGSSGFRITNAFTTPELFAAFAAKLGPVRKDVGLPEPQPPKSVDAVRYLTAHS
jgi:hypothetical protein